MIEEIVIRRARGGDKASMEVLIRKYYDAVYRYCCHHLPSPEIAEDICQDTFCSMITHFEQYVHYGKLQNYLYVIAGNKCKDYYKRNQSVLMEQSMLEEAIDRLNMQSTIEWEVTMEMQELVKKIPMEFREVIILRFYQELKFRDIAKILGITESLAKYRVKKGLELLRMQLEGGEKHEA